MNAKLYPANAPDDISWAAGVNCGILDMPFFHPRSR
jgi:hypothetical protein